MERKQKDIEKNGQAPFYWSPDLNEQPEAKLSQYTAKMTYSVFSQVYLDFTVLATSSQDAIELGRAMSRTLSPYQLEAICNKSYEVCKIVEDPIAYAVSVADGPAAGHIWTQADLKSGRLNDLAEKLAADLAADKDVL